MHIQQYRFLNNQRFLWCSCHPVSTTVPELYVGSVKQAAVLLGICRSAGRSGPCTADSDIWGFHGPKILAGRRRSPESPLSQIWPNIQLRPSHLSISEEQMWELKSVHEPVYSMCVCVYKVVRACQSKSPAFKMDPDWIMQGFNNVSWKCCKI